VSDLGPFKLLDVSATCNEAGRSLTLAVVNRDRDRPITASIQLADGAATAMRAYEVNGAHPGVVNSFEHPDAVTVQEKPTDLGGEKLQYTFPAHSVTVLRLEVGGSPA
jgi:alpha-N-arabinofuranosidase